MKKFKLFLFFILLFGLSPPFCFAQEYYDGNAKLKWNLVSDPRVEGYRAYYMQEGNWILLGETTELELYIPHMYFDGYLVPFTVRSFSGDDESANSNIKYLDFTPEEVPPPVEPPLEEPPPEEPPPTVDCDCVDFVGLYNPPPYEDLCSCGELPIWMDVRSSEIFYDCSDQSNCYVSWELPPPPEEEPPPVVEEPPPPVEEPPPVVEEPPPLEEPPPPTEEVIPPPVVEVPPPVEEPPPPVEEPLPPPPF